MLQTITIYVQKAVTKEQDQSWVVVQLFTAGVVILKLMGKTQTQNAFAHEQCPSHLWRVMPFGIGSDIHLVTENYVITATAKMSSLTWAFGWIFI